MAGVQWGGRELEISRRFEDLKRKNEEGRTETTKQIQDFLRDVTCVDPNLSPMRQGEKSKSAEAVPGLSLSLYFK